MRTTAVKANPAAGKSTVAYAQLDNVSQATLISDSLKNKLGLKIKTDHSVTLRTLADKTVPIEGRANFNLESLSTGEQFKINNALVVPQFSDDENILPHAVDVSGLEYFVGVHIPVTLERGRVDVLIGQSDKALLTVLEEREGVDPQEPNYVLTRLGPIASGGRASGTFCSSGSLPALRVNINSSVENDYNKLKEENVALREYKLLDEIIQPSKKR